eukprot:594468-Pyramimonas_sp.AAC.1
MTLGQHILETGTPFVAGGGFNVSPDVLEQALEPGRFGGAVCRPDAPTLAQGDRTSLIDFF